jgi:hypothetical protein
MRYAFLLPLLILSACGGSSASTQSETLAMEELDFQLLNIFYGDGIVLPSLLVGDNDELSSDYLVPVLEVMETELADEFQKDVDRVKHVTGVGRARLSPLVSSRYSPKKETKARFTGPYLTWKALASFYDDNPVLRRADEVYGR